MTDNQVREFLLKNIINAAIRGGAAVMKIYSHPEMFNISLKSDLSPITEADRKAHEVIKESLGATRIPILSEEGREMLFEERCNWDLFWLVDPLDGTVEFINRCDEFTINIALMSKGECVAAAVYIPCLKRLFLSARDQGAFVCENIEPQEDADYNYKDLSDRLTRLPFAKADRTNQIIAISRSHNTPDTFEHIDSLREGNPAFEIIEQGSSYKFCMLAEGSVDYYVRTSGTFEWDTAAGELILAEAGGSTKAFRSGEPLKYNKQRLDNPWFICKGPYCTIK